MRIIIYLCCCLLACQNSVLVSLDKTQGLVDTTIFSSRSYANMVQAVQQERKALLRQYPLAKTAASKTAIRQQLEAQLLHAIVDSLVPYWLGTPWDFNGITQTPGKDNIACGYFVTTLLRDAGIAINRVKYAQCASQHLIRQFCDAATIAVLSNAGDEQVMRYFKQQGAGLYLTGLDFHTGFLYYDGEELFFIHSNYIRRQGVVRELALHACFASSRYKMIGRVRVI
jgi:hypothetical protein